MFSGTLVVHDEHVHLLPAAQLFLGDHQPGDEFLRRFLRCERHQTFECAGHQVCAGNAAEEALGEVPLFQRVVEKGIEKFSTVVMPWLLVMIVGIGIFSLTLRHDGRTGLQGLGVYLIPDFSGMTFPRFLQILLDAMSQLFFSLSVSMGIMITYGSYVKKEVDLGKAISQIEFFDTGVALLAGLMVIPAVYVFSGTEGLASGPNLMFVSLPKVFQAIGSIGWVVKPAWIAEEMELGGCRFGRKKLYGIMIRYIAPLIMAVLFVQSMGLLS